MAIYVVAAVSDALGADLAALKSMVRLARSSGADAIKFQSLSAEAMAHPLYAADQYAALKSNELSRDAHFELAAECHSAGIEFISSAFDFQTVDLLCELAVPAICISSGDATNLPLISYAARREKPLLISTGMCSLAEAGDAYYCALEEGSPRVVLLHTTTEYPAPREDVNLQAISTLAGELFCEVGFADHAQGIECCVGAAALGAVVIEKHLGPPETSSGGHIATPDEFAEMVRLIRRMEAARGDGEKRRLPGEAQSAESLRRSVFYARDLPAGHVLTWEDLSFLRPVVGLSPADAYRFVGRILGVDIQKGELASEQDIAVVELKEKPGS